MSRLSLKSLGIKALIHMFRSYGLSDEKGLTVFVFGDVADVVQVKWKPVLPVHVGGLP